MSQYPMGNAFYSTTLSLQIAPYSRRIEEFMGADLPPLPKKWSYAAGWTRYGPDGRGSPVGAPLEDTFAFDVEVLVQSGPQPIIGEFVEEYSRNRIRI